MFEITYSTQWLQNQFGLYVCSNTMSGIVWQLWQKPSAPLHPRGGYSRNHEVLPSGSWLVFSIAPTQMEGLISPLSVQATKCCLITVWSYLQQVTQSAMRFRRWFSYCRNSAMRSWEIRRGWCQQVQSAMRFRRWFNYCRSSVMRSWEIRRVWCLKWFIKSSAMTCRSSVMRSWSGRIRRRYLG